MAGQRERIQVSILDIRLLTLPEGAPDREESGDPAMLVARGGGGGGVGGEAAGRLVVRVGVGVEVQLAAVQVVHALVRARRVGRVRGGDLIGEWEFRAIKQSPKCRNYCFHLVVQMRKLSLKGNRLDYI